MKVTLLPNPDLKKKKMKIKQSGQRIIINKHIFKIIIHKWRISLREKQIWALYIDWLLFGDNINMYYNSFPSSLWIWGERVKDSNCFFIQ